MEQLGQKVAFEIAAEGSSTGVASVIDATRNWNVFTRPKS